MEFNTKQQFPLVSSLLSGTKPVNLSLKPTQHEVLGSSSINLPCDLQVDSRINIYPMFESVDFSKNLLSDFKSLDFPERESSDREIFNAHSALSGVNSNSFHLNNNILSKTQVISSKGQSIDFCNRFHTNSEGQSIDFHNRFQISSEGQSIGFYNQFKVNSGSQTIDFQNLFNSNSEGQSIDFYNRVKASPGNQSIDFYNQFKVNSEGQPIDFHQIEASPENQMTDFLHFEAKSSNRNGNHIEKKSKLTNNVKDTKKIKVHKGPWSAEEDRILLQLVEREGLKSWTKISKSLPNRIGKQCRERWFNHLRPNMNKTAWTDVENEILVKAHKMFGNKWASISKYLPGRSENTIKNHYNATKRRLMNSRDLEDDNNNDPLSNYIKEKEFKIQTNETTTHNTPSNEPLTTEASAVNANDCYIPMLDNPYGFDNKGNIGPGGFDDCFLFDGFDMGEAGFGFGGSRN